MVIQSLSSAGSTSDTSRRGERAGRNPITATRFPLCWRTPNDTLLWSPIIEMYSDKDKITLRAEVPGIKKEDIDVSIVGNDLVIKGERRSESSCRGRDYIQSEMSYGNFYRSMPIPSEVRKAAVKASYEDGILQIDLPKQNGKTSRPVSVKVAGSKRRKARK